MSVSTYSYLLELPTARNFQRSPVSDNFKSRRHLIFGPFSSAALSPLRTLPKFTAVRHGIKGHRFRNPFFNDIIA